MFAFSIMEKNAKDQLVHTLLEFFGGRSRIYKLTYKFSVLVLA